MFYFRPRVNITETTALYPLLLPREWSVRRTEYRAVLETGQRGVT